MKLQKCLDKGVAKPTDAGTTCSKKKCEFQRKTVEPDGVKVWCRYKELTEGRK